MRASPLSYAAVLAISWVSSAHRSHAQSVLYVDDSAPVGGDGSGWATAHNHLTDALAHAMSTPGSDEIRIAEGVYRPDQSAANPAGTGSACATFMIPDGTTFGNVSIVGGYRGVGTAGDPNELDHTLFPTVLSGDVAGNDPAWPFTGSETEWVDNIDVLISATRGPVDLRGLRVVGARRTFYDGARNLIGATAQAWVRSTVFKDCTFASSPLRIFASSAPALCTHTLEHHAGFGLYFGQPKWWAANTPSTVTLENVVIEHVVNRNEEIPLAFFGGSATTWRGGGIRDCRLFYGVGATGFDSTIKPVVLFEDLVFERTVLGSTGQFDFAEGLIVFREGVRSNVLNCKFRDIEILSNFSHNVPVLSLGHQYEDIDTLIPRVVEGCVFEGIRDHTTKAGARTIPCLGATLVTACEFRDIQINDFAAVAAQRIEACLLENVRVERDQLDQTLSWLFGPHLVEMDVYVTAAIAFEVRGTIIRDCFTESTLLTVLSRADDCTIEQSTLSPKDQLNASVFAAEGSILSRMTVRDNILGTGGFLGFSGPSSAGVFLDRYATILNSAISGNRSNHNNDDSSSASGAWMFPGSAMYNCAVIDNGHPLTPDMFPTHVAVYAAPGVDADVSIVNSTICGNIGSHVGGVENNSFPRKVRFVNSIAAGNEVVTTDDFCAQLCPDLHAAACNCATRDIVLTNSLISQNAPAFVDADAGDYRPAPGSLAIDAAADGWWFDDFLDLDGDGLYDEPTPADALGQPRFVDDPVSPNTTPGFFLDVGAFEYQAGTLPCLADTNGDGDVTPADFGAWIAAFNAQSPACDQNGDGLCSPADFGAWIANFNAGC